MNRGLMVQRVMRAIDGGKFQSQLEMAETIVDELESLERSDTLWRKLVRWWRSI